MLSRRYHWFEGAVGRSETEVHIVSFIVVLGVAFTVPAFAGMFMVISIMAIMTF